MTIILQSVPPMTLRQKLNHEQDYFTRFVIIILPGGCLIFQSFEMCIGKTVHNRVFCTRTGNFFDLDSYHLEDQIYKTFIVRTLFK